MSLELRQLKYFAELYKFQNFRTAAEELRISQSALSKSIQSLEDRLQLKLFDRTTRSVTPTGSGHHLKMYIGDILSKTAELEHEALMLSDGQAGVVRVGAGTFPQECLLAPALERLIAKKSDIVVDIRSGSLDEMLGALSDHELDFVLFDMSSYEVAHRTDEIDIEDLPHEPVVALFRDGHPIKTQRLSPETALQYSWATPAPSPFFIRKLPAEIRHRIKLQFRMESVSSCLTLMERSDVLTAIPLSIARKLAEERNFGYTKITSAFVTNVGLHTIRRRTLSPAAEVLLKEVRDVATENAANG